MRVAVLVPVALLVRLVGAHGAPVEAVRGEDGGRSRRHLTLVGDHHVQVALVRLGLTRERYGEHVLALNHRIG